MQKMLLHAVRRSTYLGKCCPAVGTTLLYSLKSHKYCGQRFFGRCTPAATNLHTEVEHLRLELAVPKMRNRLHRRSYHVLKDHCNFLASIDATKKKRPRAHMGCAVHLSSSKRTSNPQANSGEAEEEEFIAAKAVERFQNVLNSRKAGQHSVTETEDVNRRATEHDTPAGKRRRGKRQSHQSNLPSSGLTSRELTHLELRHDYFNFLSATPPNNVSRSDYLYKLFRNALADVQSGGSEALLCVDISMLTRTIDEFVTLNMLEEALEVIASFEAQSSDWSNLLLGSSEQTGDTSKPYSMNAARKIARLYQVAICAFGNAGSPHVAFDLYRRMSHQLRKAVSPGISSKLVLREAFPYERMLRLCARHRFGGRRREAEWWFHEMVRVGLKPTLVGVRHLLLACEKEPVLPSQNVSYRGANRMSSQYCNYDAAEQWFSVANPIMKDNYSQPKNLRSGWHAQNDRQWQKRRVKRARQIRNLYNTMMRCCAKAPGGAKMERAEELFMELCSFSALGEWRNNWQKDHAGKKTSFDLGNGLLPNAISYTGLILACARQADGCDLDRATALYREHVKLASIVEHYSHHKSERLKQEFHNSPENRREYQTNSDILTAMIECCSKSTKKKKGMVMSEAQNYFNRLTGNRGLGSPTINVYNHMLSCCARAPVRSNDLALAEKLFKSITSGHQEDLSSENAFVSTIENKRFHGISEASLHPNIDTYNAILLACANVIDDHGGAHTRKAEMYYAMMKSEGNMVIPNETTFEAMITAEQRSRWPRKDKIEEWRNELDWWRSSNSRFDVPGTSDDGSLLGIQATFEEFGVGDQPFSYETKDSHSGYDWEEH